MKRVFLCIFFIPFCFISVFSKSSVWVIEKNGTKIYLAGSVHRLQEKDYPLPVEFEKAYNNSEILVLESDNKELKTSENYMKLINAGTYRDERTIESVLNEEVYNELQSMAIQYNIDLERMKKYKPSFVILGFTYQVLLKNGINAEGVDLYFQNKAIENKKPVLFLETFEDGVRFIENMGKGNENEFIQHSLNDLKMYENFDEVIEIWKAGEVKPMQKQVEVFRQNFPNLYKLLLVERNNNWVPQLESFLKTKEIELVVFGALHLYGPDGILQLMKNKGYTVRQL